MVNNFWHNKKILITGVHGFVGSNLCKSLINEGAEIYGIYKYNSSKSLLTIEKINDFNAISFLNTNLNQLCELLNDKEIEICFHLAAQVEVGKAMNYPFDTLNNNINPTLNLLEALRNSKFIKKIIFSSTDKVYGEIEKSKLPYREIYTPIPKYPYEVSKLICELSCKCYYENYNLPIITTRTSNLYGPGQLNFSALIPDLILSALNRKTFTPRSNGEMLREYLFIDDWINILKQIVQNEDDNLYGETFNFGPDRPISIKEITKIIYDKINSKKTSEIMEKFNNVSNNNEIILQFLDTGKSRKYFDLTKLITIDSGINKTIKWYKKFF